MSSSSTSSEFSAADKSTYHFALVKKDDSGKRKTQFWRATVECLPDSAATSLTWEWGYEDSKKDPQRRNRVYEKGKANRTPMKQALQECKHMMIEKQRIGYVKDPRKTNSSLVINDEDENDNVVSGVPKAHGPVVAKPRKASKRSADPKLPEGTSMDDRPPPVMLAKDFNEHPEFNECGGFLMPKLDGIFCVANLSTGKLWSRARLPLVGMPHIEAGVALLKEQPLAKEGKLEWIVGELYKHGWDFNKITGLVRKQSSKSIQEASAEIGQLRFHVFDGMPTNRTMPFQQRYQLLQELLRDCDPSLVLVPTTPVDNICSSVEEFHANCIKDGYEGAMIHPNDDPGYQNKRTKWLLKFKKFQQEEYECIEIQPQKHNGAEGPQVAGSVLLRAFAGGPTFSATPKCPLSEKTQMWKDRDKYVGQIATVKFFELTSANQVPRFPVLLGFRHPDDMSDDKKTKQ